MNNIIQDSTANIKQHFDKYRALSLGELYCFLNNCFKDYIEYSSFVVYIEQNSSLHIPRCVFSDKKRKIRVLPILIINQNSSHYNILIINNDKRTVERFEPSDYCYDGNINKLLTTAFTDNKYKYIYTKHLGPQFMEIHEVGVTMNCGYWVLLYIQDRLNDISCKQKHFLSKWMESISKHGFHNLICDYKRYVLNTSMNYRHTDDKYICYNIYNRRPLDYYDYKLKNDIK
jgi:hypothetical protein